MSGDARKITAVMFKSEGAAGTSRDVGPVYVQVDGRWENFRDGDTARPFAPFGFFPAWFKIADARRIAKTLGLPLEQH